MEQEIRIVEGLDRKWPLGVTVSEWKGTDRLDVRTYNPNEMKPTKKGISVPIDDALLVISTMLDVYCENTGQGYSLEISPS